MGKNFYLKLYLSICFALFLIIPFNVHAQIVNKGTNVSFLNQNALTLQQKLDENRQLAYALAPEKGWETIRVTKNGDIIALQGVDDLGLPIYYTTYSNILAAATTSTNKLYLNGGLGLNLNGSTLGKGKVAIWDGGAVLLNHVELINRVTAKDNNKTVSTHSTHVAGTMMATGLNPIVRGMAYALPELFSFDFSNDISEMSANAAALLISNHSYGSIAGWNYNSDVSPARWEFWGTYDANEDYKFGFYDNSAREWDRICYNAPYYLPVKSAGNNRGETGPAVGAVYYRFNSSASMVAAGPRPAELSSNNSYDIIPTYGTAKNILTVGAVYPLLNGPTATTPPQIAPFSSWGPTDDGRIKPDIVGDGVNVTSTSGTGTSLYTTLSGTSMSSPNVSGSLTLLQELYSQKNNGEYMRSATLKALVIGTAVEAGNHPGPDYIYGWGLLNTEAAAKAILSKNTSSLFTESSLAQGATQTIYLIASGYGPLVATLCWTDPEATPVATAVALNNPALRLVNDLDMKASQGASTYRPWILDPARPSAAATTGDNFRDNVEQIYIADAVPGRIYTFSISHKGTLQRGPQAYSLVATGVSGTAYCNSAPNSTADSRINNFKLANIDQSNPANLCTGYSDFTARTIELEKGRTYPLSLTLGTCGANANKIAKVFVDWNNDGDFNDEEELVATSNMINGTGTFTSNVTIPHMAINNNYSLLRVVLTETDDATKVLPCGNYAKGETQDYRVKFLTPAIDVGVTAILNPTATSCANPTQTINLMIKNLGLQTASNIPIIVDIKENATVVATLNTTYLGSLLPQADIELSVAGSFNAQEGKTYTVAARTALATDLITGNDGLTSTVKVSVGPVATASSAYFCNSANAYVLNTNSDGIAFWYKNNTDTNPIAFGNTINTAIKPDNNTFSVGINDFRTSVGPKNKEDIGNGGYGQFTPSINITAMAPTIIESAKLYVGNAGQVKFTVVNSAGLPVSSVLLSVDATRTIPQAGPSDNDPADRGKVYPLNLEIPSAGTYTINVEYFGATLFRNNVFNTTYPYRTALDLFSIDGNTATNTGDPSYSRTLYFYFYDMKVRIGKGCIGSIKTAVPLTTASITQNDKTLTSSSPNNNQWYLNGKIIPGATGQQYTAVQNGIYHVEISIADCILKSKELSIYTINPSSAENEINLKTYPVPTNGELNIYFEVVEKNNVSIVLSNLMGQVAFKEEKVNYNGIYTNKVNLNTFAAGVYVLKVKVGNKVYNRKVTLVK